MKTWPRLRDRGHQDPDQKPPGPKASLFRRAGLVAIITAIAIAFVAGSETASFAQRTTRTTALHGFNLTGDIKVDESPATDEQKPMVLDVILYTDGNQLVGRQRVSPGGRYRFMDLYDGGYYLVVEVETREIARVSVLITPQSPVDLRQDVNLEWRSTRARNAGGVVSAADLYNRSASQTLLYQKATKEIESKNYTEAIATLRGLVAADPSDFPALADLGMLYLIQKDYEAAENSYVAALAAKPEYFTARLNLGRVQLARKDYEHAIESLEAALKIEPKSAPANFFLGEAYLQIKKGSKAVVYLNQALSIDPIGMAEAHLRLGLLYNGAGMKDKAAAEYEQFLKKKPDYPERKKLEQYIAENKKP